VLVQAAELVDLVLVLPAHFDFLARRFLVRLRQLPLERQPRFLGLKKYNAILPCVGSSSWAILVGRAVVDEVWVRLSSILLARGCQVEPRTPHFALAELAIFGGVNWHEAGPAPDWLLASYPC